MRTFIPFDTPKFTIISIGNGMAYQFLNKAEKVGVFFQGDDATVFENEFESGRDLDDLWSDYSDVAKGQVT